MTAINGTLPYLSRRPIVCANNMVVTSQPLAAQAGMAILQNGGNAIDAAIATAITLTVVEPTGTGVGGDAFAILWDGKQLHGLNASGYSPRAWTPEAFAQYKQMPARGWQSVTVPGAVAAWKTLSDRFGRLPFEKLFEAAINYAEHGFPVSPTIAKLWAAVSYKYDDQPGFRDTFMPKGRAPLAGERFANPDLAKSLKQIADSGGESFYRGELAQQMVKHAQQHGGLIDLDDLADYQPLWCGTIEKTLKQLTVHEIPPNCQGIATLIALGIIDCFDWQSMDVDGLEFTHLCIEAMKLAFADCATYVADPDHMTIEAQQFLSDAYLESRAELIRLDAAQEYGAGAPSDGGTVYLATADADGLMVSFIQSNYEGFGSGVVVPGTGISMQNRGMGFSLTPGHPNQVGPRKRPFHTIIPGFATKNGEPHMAFGVMGGPMQAQGHLQMVVRTQLFEQNPQAACDAPRWQVRHGKEVMVEATMAPELIAGLRGKGHDIIEEDGEAVFAFGGAQIIERGQYGYVGGSDYRKDGLAIGF
ncbi:MAG TPA: gamma-glutamyltransferase family protein [Burkholderiaceae bacterium]|nr:gamma-glutamyltransferase family protein [Burkholderiaceae bacterium]